MTLHNEEVPVSVQIDVEAIFEMPTAEESTAPLFRVTAPRPVHQGAVAALFMLTRIMPVSVYVGQFDPIDVSELLGPLGFDCWVDLGREGYERQRWSHMGKILVTNKRICAFVISPSRVVKFKDWHSSLIKFGNMCGPEFQQRAMEVAKGGIV